MWKNEAKAATTTLWRVKTGIPRIKMKSENLILQVKLLLGVSFASNPTQKGQFYAMS